jgi:hypothetical protein
MVNRSSCWKRNSLLEVSGIFDKHPSPVKLRLIAFLCLSAASHAQTFVIQGARVFDGEKLLGVQEVLVARRKISVVPRSVSVPHNAVIVDRPRQGAVARSDRFARPHSRLARYRPGIHTAAQAVPLPRDHGNFPWSIWPRAKFAPWPQHSLPASWPISARREIRLRSKGGQDPIRREL